MKIKIFLLTLFVFTVTTLHIMAAEETDCIVCAQFVPDCGPDEKLVPQTCKQCAHCELIVEEKQETMTSCQQCLIHAQCPYWHKCIEGCCVKKNHRRNPDVVIRKEVHKIVKKAVIIPKKVKKDLTVCKNPCGAKCCKAGKKCIIIDQCKGTKGKCKLPVLKFCSSKPPEKIGGRLDPL